MAKRIKDFIRKFRNAIMKEIRAYSGELTFETLYTKGEFEKISEQSARVDDMHDERPYLNAELLDELNQIDHN